MAQPGALLEAQPKIPYNAALFHSTNPTDEVPLQEVQPDNSANERALAVIGAFLIVVVGFLVYFPSISLPLHGEDQTRFVDDASLHRISTYTDALGHWPHAPLTVFGYALNWVLLPLNGAGLRLVNILLHVLSGVLLYLLARRLLGKGVPEPLAMLPGLALVLHPLATESVNYLYARPTLQATCFALAATLVFLRVLDARTLRPLLLAFALLLYFLAFASSFVVLGLPLIWLAFAKVSADGREPALVRNANLAALGMMFALLAARWATGAGGAIDTPQGVMQTLAAQSQTAGGLRHITGANDILANLNAAATPSLLGLAILAVCLLAGAAAFFGFSLGVPAWWGFIALASIPCLTDRSAAFSEAQLYFPLAGLFLALAVALQKIPVQNVRYAAGALFAVLLALSAYQSYTRTIEWSNPITFWGDAALEHPDAITPRLYQGRYLMGMAKTMEDPADARSALELAMNVWQAAERVDASHPETLAKLGETLHRLGEYDAAIEKLEAALRENPFYPGISVTLALAHERNVQGPTDTAALAKVATHFQRADLLGELSPQSRGRYGIALLTLGDIENAQMQLRTAQTADPNLPFGDRLAHIERNLAEAQHLQTQSMQAFQEKPGEADGVMLRARGDLLRGETKRAFYMLDRTILRYPDNRDVWLLYGVARAALGNTAGFVRDADEKFAGSGDFWAELAVQCAVMGNWPATVAYLEHAAQWAEPGTAPPRAQAAGIAATLQQIPIARRLAEEAAQMHPGAPEPWLLLAQIAIAAQDENAARDYLNEAEKRGADPEAIKTIREHGEVEMDIPAAPVRTIIR